MKRQDFILLAAASITTQPLTPQQLQYTMFLLAVHQPAGLPKDFHPFHPGHYGPANHEEIHKDAQVLELEGFRFNVPARHSSWNNLAPSPAGMEKARTLREEISPALQAYITKVVRWTQANTFRQNFRAICNAFPEYAGNAVFRETNTPQEATTAAVAA